MNAEQIHEIEKKVRIVSLDKGEVSIHHVPKADFDNLKKIGCFYTCGNDNETKVVVYGGITFFAAGKEEAD